MSGDNVRTLDLGAGVVLVEERGLRCERGQRFVGPGGICLIVTGLAMPRHGELRRWRVAAYTATDGIYAGAVEIAAYTAVGALRELGAVLQVLVGARS